MSETEVECLAELFRCFICMQQLQSARLCPHCSKLCCAPCIERWLAEQRQECPHCREPLQRVDLVKCRWAEEVTQQLESMRSITQESKVMELQLEKDKCFSHEGEKLSVFCVSCQMCICHLCALFVGQHSGHSFKPLDEEYELHRKRITDEAAALRQRLMQLEGLKRDLDKNMETVKFAKEDRELEMRTAYDSMVKKLESQLKNKLSTLKGQKNSICNETEFLEKILSTVEREMQQKSKSELISSVGHLMDMFAKVHETPMSNFASVPVPADFVSEIVPQYESSTFALKNFSMLKRKADPVYSTHLCCQGVKWRLKVYPDGNGIARSNYLSVFLELVEGPSETSKYEYKVEMIQCAECLVARDLGNVVREFASDFEVGECWGYNRFFRLDQLEEGGYLDGETDTVTLKFHVRSPTFAQQCRDQASYIAHLEEAQAQHIEQLNNLKCSLKERKRATKEARQGAAECVPARDVNGDCGRNENSIEANDMNSTRNVDDPDLEYLPPPFSEGSGGEEGEEDDSTLQKIRYSLQLESSDHRPLSADSWERRLMSQIGVSSFPGTSVDNMLDSSLPASEIGSSIVSVTTDDLEPELAALVDTESDTELPTLNGFTPDLLIQVAISDHPRIMSIATEDSAEEEEEPRDKEHVQDAPRSKSASDQITSCDPVDISLVLDNEGTRLGSSLLDKS